LESIRAAPTSFSVSAVPGVSSKMNPTGLTFVVPSVKPALSATFSESCTANVPAFVTAAVPRFAVTVPETGCVTAEPSTFSAFVSCG
jgi:hypothetical protein